MTRLPFSSRLAVPMLLVAAYCTGCSGPPIKPVMGDPDPSIGIPAIKVAVANHDESAVPSLIKQLPSDDPAVRFYANDALKKLTGRDFGFLYYAEEEQRRPAVKRWQAWLASGGPTTRITTSQP